jgi:hypothetical protein
LVSPAEKRKRLEDVVNSEATVESSCARTDAKPVDRDVQMKYDIAKNEEGPLRRTVKSQLDTQSTNKGKQKAVDLNENNGDEGCLTTRHPGLDSRLTDIEAHLAVRYGMRTVLRLACPHPFYLFCSTVSASDASRPTKISRGSYYKT